MKVEKLFHKMGGRITNIHAVGHRYEDGVPYWFYVCDVTWDDNKESRRIDVMPDRLCADQSDPEAVAEVNKASDALTDYLRKYGRWLKKGEWVNERLVHWKPRVKLPIEHTVAI